MNVFFSFVAVVVDKALRDAFDSETAPACYLVAVGAFSLVWMVKARNHFYVTDTGTGRRIRRFNR